MDDLSQVLARALETDVEERGVRPKRGSPADCLADASMKARATRAPSAGSVEAEFPGHGSGSRSPHSHAAGRLAGLAEDSRGSAAGRRHPSGLGGPTWR